MSFTFRVANTRSKENRNRLTLQPDPADYHAFEVGACFDVDITGRVVTLTPSLFGVTTVEEPARYKNAAYPRTLACQHSQPIDTFGITELSFDLVDGVLTCELPPIHELPWSSSAPVKRAVENVVREQLTARVRSAFVSGDDVRRIAQSAPRWARGVLRGDEWMAILSGKTLIAA